MRKLSGPRYTIPSTSKGAYLQAKLVRKWAWVKIEPFNLANPERSNLRAGNSLLIGDENPCSVFISCGLLDHQAPAGSAFGGIPSSMGVALRQPMISIRKRKKKPCET